MQRKSSQKHEVIIEYKEDAKKEPDGDEHSILENEIDTIEDHIPYIDDNVSNIFLGDEDSEKKHQTREDEVKPNEKVSIVEKEKSFHLNITNLITVMLIKDIILGIMKTIYDI